MAYIKKEFDGEYLRWYNTISANHGNVSNTLNNISISPNINGLDWKGQGQEEFCHSFSQLDVACEHMQSEIL